METIVCTLCVTEKPISEFYKNNRMPNGYANQCKECVKARTKAREERLRQYPEWVENERIRHRAKYHRLNYKEKQLEWDKNKPWKKSSVYKNLHRNMKIDKTQTLHHWNYNYLKDVFILSKEFHKFIHIFLKFDNKTKCFIAIDGMLLNTKEKHTAYLQYLKHKYREKTMNK